MRLEWPLEWAIRNGENGSRPGETGGASDTRYEGGNGAAYEKSVAVGRSKRTFDSRPPNRTDVEFPADRETGALERIVALEAKRSQSSAGAAESASGTSVDRVR